LFLRWVELQRGGHGEYIRRVKLGAPKKNVGELAQDGMEMAANGWRAMLGRIR